MKFVLEHDETECDTIKLHRTNLAPAIYQVAEFISAFARHGKFVTQSDVFQNDVPEGTPTLGDYLLNYEMALSNINEALSMRLKKQGNVSREMRKTAYKVLSDSKLSKSEIKAALKVIGSLIVQFHIADISDVIYCFGNYPESAVGIKTRQSKSTTVQGAMFMSDYGYFPVHALTDCIVLGKALAYADQIVQSALQFKRQLSETADTTAQKNNG